MGRITTACRSVAFGTMAGRNGRRSCRPAVAHANITRYAAESVVAFKAEKPSCCLRSRHAIRKRLLGTRSNPTLLRPTKAAIATAANSRSRCPGRSIRPSPGANPRRSVSEPRNQKCHPAAGLHLSGGDRQARAGWRDLGRICRLRDGFSVQHLMKHLWSARVSFRRELFWQETDPAYECSAV